MIYGIYHSAAGLQIQEYRQSLIANNLANAETPGFKPDMAAIVERSPEALDGTNAKARHRVLDRMTGGLFEMPVHTDFTDGPLEVTNNPLDVAIVGGGFLRVATPEGERYTRDGRLTIDAQGSLVNASNGLAILGDNGTPIRVDPSARAEVTIHDDGTVRQGEVDVGRIALVDFDDRSRLTKQGRNLYAADDLTTRPATGAIRSGAVEQSAVDPVNSLVQMMAASRAYEMNAALISLQDQTLNRVVNDLGRLS